MARTQIVGMGGDIYQITTNDPMQYTKDILVQINGKARTSLSKNKDATSDELERTALADAKVIQYVGGRKIIKIEAIPGRIVNIRTDMGNNSTSDT